MHVARSRLLDGHGFGSAGVPKVFIEMNQVWNPDVIHLHNLHGYHLHIGLLFGYLKEACKSVVWTLHDCWAFTGHCSYFDSCGCDRWKSECHDCPQKSQYPRSWLIDSSRRNYQDKNAIFTGVRDLTLVAPSRWLAGLIGESFLKNYPVEVIPNGIALEVFSPTPSDFRQRHGLEGMFVMLGVAGVWGERKGYQTFVELAKRLRADEAIVMVGLSHSQIRHLPPGIIGPSPRPPASEPSPGSTALRMSLSIRRSTTIFRRPTWKHSPVGRRCSCMILAVVRSASTSKPASS